jgi:hypothetical protein
MGAVPKALTTALGALLLSACSIHPRPEDYINVSTYDIVNRIRCESRAAVINSVETYLATREDPATVLIWKEHQEAGGGATTVKPSDYPGDVGRLLALFWRTGIVFNFSLDMTEVNNVGAEAHFLRPLARTGLNLELKTALDRQRQNVRTFTIADDFAGLLEVPAATCKGQIVGENFIYPITGKIGVEKMIHAFIYLTLFQNLSGKADNVSGPPTMGDSLEFTTTVTGSATPQVTFAEVGKHFQIADGQLSGTVTRTDVHKVVVGLAVDPSASGQVIDIRNDVGRRLISVAPRTRAQLAAAIVVDQIVEQQALSRTIVIER